MDRHSRTPAQIRRDSILAMLAADERRLGHADANVRAELRQSIQDALDLRTLSFSEGMAAIGRPDATYGLLDTLATPDLAAVRDAVEALPHGLRFTVVA